MYRLQRTVTCANSRITTLVSLFLITFFHGIAQHKTELWGVTGIGGPQNAGFLFKYDVANNTLEKRVWLNKQHTSTKTYFTGFFGSGNGYLYAIKTQNDSADKSTIVRWNPQTNVLEKMYTFDPDYYTMVSSTLTAFNGKYYGMAYAGKKAPYTFVGGIIFEWNPVTNVLTNRFYFEGRTAGSNPRGQLLLYNNKFYGTTTTGGVNGNGDGVLFEWDPVTNQMTKKADFAEAVTGRSPDSFLQLYDGKLYAICLVGGANSGGTLFEYTMATGQLKKIYDLPARVVHGKTVLLGSKFYAVLEYGSVFEMDLATKTPKTHAVGYPNGTLTWYNGSFYGISNGVYTNSIDVASPVMRWTPGEPGAVYLTSFQLSNIGADVPGTLMTYNNKLYGITERGSVTGMGSIFELDPVTNQVIYKNYFGSGINGYSGNNLNSSLHYYEGNFWGTTVSGGLYDRGFLYSYDPETNIVASRHNFTTDEGGPYGNLGRMGSGNVFSGVIKYQQNYGGGRYYYELANYKYISTGIELPANSRDFYENGIGNTYAAIGNYIYAARPQAGQNEPAGIYYCFDGNNNFTRKFTFPVSIVPAQEKGLAVFRDRIIGMGRLQSGQTLQYVIYEYNTINDDFRYTTVNVVQMTSLMGKPVELNNKLYVLSGTGCYGNGSLIEWDQTTNTAASYCLANYILEGKVFGSVTAAEGRLYGYTSKGIFCFDPANKSFKTVFSIPTGFFDDYSLENDKNLVLRVTNATPQMSTIDTVGICLDGSLTREIPFSVTDADQDAVKVTATSQDSTLMQNYGIIEKGNGQYALRIAVVKKEDTATITIRATDSMQAVRAMSVVVITTNPQPVTFSFAKDTLCSNDTAVLLTGGLPVGGIYSIDGTPTDSLSPKKLTEGAHTLKYAFKKGGCTDFVVHHFYVKTCGLPNGRATLLSYPNPSTGEVKLENREHLLSTITVMNAQGHTVYTTQSAANPLVLHLEKLKSGIYYIRIVNQKGTFNSRVEIVK